MDLRTHLLSLIAPLQIGEECAVAGLSGPSPRLEGVSTEVGLWLSFSLSPGEVQIEIAPLGEGRFAARTARHAISYRVEGGRNPVDPGRALGLCRALAERVAQNEQRMVQLPVTPSPEGPRVREVRVTSVLEPAGHGAERFYKLSPYAGCLIGCRYCYAQTPMSTLRRLERLPEVAWGSYVDVRINTAELLAAELERLDPHPIKFCPILSDPYQPAEARYRLTRDCLSVIGRASRIWPKLVLTRSKLVMEDAELLASQPATWVGASLPTVDDETRRHFEPRAASIAERLEALTRLRAMGVKTFAVVQPLLPGSIEALADAFAIAVTSVSIDVLRGEEQATGDFDDPRYHASRTDTWQQERRAELTAALVARGIPVWSGELPPELLPPAVAPAGDGP